MKERPILFSGPMVQAILDGRKSQTRRIIKPQPISISWFEHQQGWCARVREDMGSAKEPAYVMVLCPYGAPGDRLWVREAHCIGISGLPNGMGIVPIKSEAIKPGMKVVYKQGANYGDDPPPWRPSIHMPRWASRLTLEITEIRVQRLQEMEEQNPLESDAIAEGVNRIHHGDGYYYFSAFRNEPHPKNWIDPADAFKELWESISGPGSWAANPWVWCVSFKRVQP